MFAKAKVMVPSPEHAFWMDDAKMAAAPEAKKSAFNNVRSEGFQRIVSGNGMVSAFHFPFRAFGPMAGAGNALMPVGANV